MWALVVLIAVFAVIGLGFSLVGRKQRKLYRRQPPEGFAKVAPGREHIEHGVAETRDGGAV